jgi:hypothetical protein
MGHAVCKSNSGKRLHDPLVTLSTRERGELERQLYILVGGEDRNKVLKLKDKTDVGRSPSGQCCIR